MKNGRQFIVTLVFCYIMQYNIIMIAVRNSLPRNKHASTATHSRSYRNETGISNTHSGPSESTLHTVTLKLLFYDIFIHS